MTTGATVPVPNPGQWWRGLALSLLCIAVVIFIMLRFVRLDELTHLLTMANPWWLMAALLCKLLGPFVTAIVYDRTLRLLGYRLKLLSFWLIAQVATLVNAALPAGPLAMSALLLRHFRRRGIPATVTTVAVALDTLTYQVVFFATLLLSIAYLLAQGRAPRSVLIIVGVLTLGLIVGYVWLRRLDRDNISRFLIRVQQWLAQRLHQPWQPAVVEGFIDALARDGALVRAQPLAIARLLVYQAAVIWLDILVLVCVFHALGHAPPILTIVLSTTLAAVLATLTPLPGGGGAFETTLALSSIQAGVPQDVAVGVTLIYRILTFWLPLLLTAATFQRLIGPKVTAPE